MIALFLCMSVVHALHTTLICLQLFVIDTQPDLLVARSYSFTCMRSTWILSHAGIVSSVQ